MAWRLQSALGDWSSAILLRRLLVGTEVQPRFGMSAESVSRKLYHRLSPICCAFILDNSSPKRVSRADRKQPAVLERAKLLKQLAKPLVRDIVRHILHEEVRVVLDLADVRKDLGSFVSSPFRGQLVGLARRRAGAEWADPSPARTRGSPRGCRRSWSTPSRARRRASSRRPCNGSSRSSRSTSSRRPPSPSSRSTPSRAGSARRRAEAATSKRGRRSCRRSTCCQN